MREPIKTAEDEPVQALAWDAEWHDLPPHDDLRCNVCNGESEHPAVGVACSTLGAFSFAYCRACLRNRAEPFSLLSNTVLWDARGLENCAEWVHYLTTWHEGRYISVHDLPPLTDEEVARLQEIDDRYALDSGEFHDANE